MPKVIIVGCGFLGEAAADLFLKDGWSVLGLCGHEESARRLEGKGLAISVIDITQEYVAPAAWRGADALVFCASTRGGDPSAYRSVYLDGLLNSIAAFKPRRVLFCSSTSVYAQTDGSIIDEESEANPPRDAGLTLRDAEGVTLACGGYVARLAGLYGPGRSVLLKKFLADEAVIEGEGRRWINQIHRDDAASAIIRLFTHRAAPGVYNVADDTPTSQREIYEWLSEFHHKPLPPSTDTPQPTRRGWSNKRVSNAKLRAIGWAPVYPSFREALQHLPPAGDAKQ